MNKNFNNDGLNKSSSRNDLFSIMADFYAIDYFTASAYLEKIGLKVSQIIYQESKFADFIIIDQNIKPGEKISKDSMIIFTLSGKNPINYLTSVFIESDEKNNDFLKRFLWIFQHIFNSMIFKLDNLYKFFDPMMSPNYFFNWIFSWFYKSFDYEIHENKLRKFLKQSFYLNQHRSTKNSLTLILEIITEIKPEIIENYIPLSEFKIENDVLSEKVIIERNCTKNSFTVYFPVDSDFFSINEIRTIDKIIKSEKPVNSEYYILFKKKKSIKNNNDLIIGQNIFLTE
ncbi:MAG: PASTA domain-containing protein [Spirochaetes bacterium]|nr:PASTA domain-containing protein [Spirochaetota bacterium]